MDVIAAVKFYINRMVEECGTGMKVLLMDRETTTIVSMVFAQSEMLQKEVYLFERIDSQHTGEVMKYLKCFVFVRPIEENIELLRKELKSPRFGQYHIYFSNIISKSDIKLLAEADEHEVVKDVQEIYCDYVAVSPHLFSINVPQCYHGFSHWNNAALTRTSQGIVSVLLALSKCPVIRYQSSSDMCKRLAESIRQTIAKEGSLFDFRKGSTNSSIYGEPVSTPVLLLLDRKFDPVTPLLNQWTYQAMLHELLTITNNRVNLSEVPGITKDLKEVVLSQEHDEFYEKNMYLNWGEILLNIKELMDEFQTKSKSQQKVESISDMKLFIENYPQFKKMSGTVSKHVTIIGELSRLISTGNLLDVSEAEQELACQSDHSESLKKIRRLITNDKLRDIDALRLVMLYALRYERQSNNEIHSLVDSLKRRGLSDRQFKMVHQMQEFAKMKGTNSTSELLTTENVKAFSKKLIKGLKGVENIYTQHSPLIRETIEELAKGKLKEVQFPYLGSVQPSSAQKPQEIIVFIVGGATYDESFNMFQLNKSFPGTKVILGSTCIHNFKSFIEELRSASTSSLNPFESTRSKVL